MVDPFCILFLTSYRCPSNYKGVRCEESNEETHVGLIVGVVIGVIIFIIFILYCLKSKFSPLLFVRLFVCVGFLKSGNFQ